MKTRIGYFIPEFPGQTHIFFWREKQALGELGVETDLVSTRHPPRALVSHAWAEEAQAITNYLIPRNSEDFAAALLEVLKAGPIAWVKCFNVLLRATDVSWKQKIRLLALMVISGKLVRLARKQGWSHIHVHSCADSANLALFASLLSDLSYSLTLHGPISDYGPNQAQKWSHASFAIVITQKLYDEAQQQLAGNLPETVEIAPMGVDSVVFQRHSPYSPWKKEAGSCYLLSCGRLNPCKGHADLIIAISNLKQRGVRVQLDIAGTDEQGGQGYRKDLERLIEELGLQDSVRLLGAVSEAVIKTALEKAHVFVLASLHEPLGVAIMEAMAMQVPVVVTGSGGVKELVEDGRDGLLVEPENPEMIADAVEKILENPELALELSHNSRQKIVENFSHWRSAKVLNRCLEQSRPGLKEYPRRSRFTQPEFR